MDRPVERSIASALNFWRSEPMTKMWEVGKDFVCRHLRMNHSVSMSSPWCAYASGKEAWKREGNFFTAEELHQMDRADDVSLHEPMECSMSAD
jgi:hypothetical protein